MERNVWIFPGPPSSGDEPTLGGNFSQVGISKYPPVMNTQLKQEALVATAISNTRRFDDALIINKPNSVVLMKLITPNSSSSRGSIGVLVRSPVVGKHVDLFFDVANKNLRSNCFFWLWVPLGFVYIDVTNSTDGAIETTATFGTTD